MQTADGRGLFFEGPYICICKRNVTLSCVMSLVSMENYVAMIKIMEPLGLGSWEFCSEDYTVKERCDIDSLLE